MSFRDFILNNFWQKIFSLVLAMLIWFAINSNLEKRTIFPSNPLRPTLMRDFRRPIKILTSANNTRAFKVEPKEVDVRISGDADKVKHLNPNDIQPYVELHDSETNGMVGIKLTPPIEVLLDFINPTQVWVEPLIPEP